MNFDDINVDVEQYGSFVEGKEFEAGVLATFLSNDIREIEGKYGLQYAFDVMIDDEKRTIATSSKRLLAKLKQAAPLSEKTVFIQRYGTGYETDYKVEVKK